jgi:uncharacterized repeat protein (TIGR01451 family)/MYXO-CTERM domain-containing protein
VVVERPGVFSVAVTADASVNATSTAGPRTYYQSTADVTALVLARGPGAYRVGDIDSVALANVNDTRLYVAWTVVVFYRLDSDPPRNLALFDGLDILEPAARPLVQVPLSGFLVPAAGFDAKLGVVAYEGDVSSTGDALSFNGVRLTNALNPANNFFNSTRSFLGQAVSLAGDLPRLTGLPGSTSGYDLDVVDVTARLAQGDTSALIEASTTGDFVILGAFVTSIATFKPDFSSTGKTVANLSRSDGTVRPGDVLEYTVVTTNTGNDPGMGVVLTDRLPPGLTLVPGTIRIAAGDNAGTKSDGAGDDQADYDAATRTITVRLGAGATAQQGGSLAVGASATVAFRVRVEDTASGTIANQAVIRALGRAGAPAGTYPSDGNGAMPGAPPTTFTIDPCAVMSCPEAGVPDAPVDAPPASDLVAPDVPADLAPAPDVAGLDGRLPDGGAGDAPVDRAPDTLAARDAARDGSDADVATSVEAGTAPEDGGRTAGSYLAGGGCRCSFDTTPTQPTWPVLLVALLFRRRRRR